MLELENAREKRPWGAAAIWCAVLAAIFFSTYGWANWLTEQRTDVGVYVLPWERNLPFLAWTIVPYWSIDLLYGLSLFLCASRAELSRHVRRLLMAQAVCMVGFLLFPLRFSFERPASEGLFGVMFDALMGFDRPYNQAPSLHICLLVVLWQHYARHVDGKVGRTLLHIWFGLIGVSVLTTYQHHFVDLVTGAWAGMLCLFAVDGNGARWRWGKWREDHRRSRLASCYALGSLFCWAVASLVAPTFLVWLLVWSGATLMLIACVYLFGEGAHFGKRDGRLPWWSWGLFAPYFVGARINAWLWGRRIPSQAHVHAEVYLGRLPVFAPWGTHQAHRIVDLCAELAPRGLRCGVDSVPMLDLVVPDIEQLHQAADAIEQARRAGPVLVCCALGVSRSACAVLAWLMKHCGLPIREAQAVLASARPQVVIHDGALARLEQFATKGRA